jgi:hypothetical protein
MTKTVAFVTDLFYYEFVICDQVARVTKRAFKVNTTSNFYDQSTTMSLAKAREYYRQLQAANS